MGSRHYTDREKALAIVELETNDGNIKRTARNTGIPAPTIRRWKQEMEREGIPQGVLDEIEPVVSDFLDDAIRVRHKLLRRLEEFIEAGKITPGQAATAFGILSDKIRSYEAVKETRKVEHQLVLPPAEELKELMVGVLDGVVADAKQRSAEIEAVMEPVAVTAYREIPQEIK